MNTDEEKLRGYIDEIREASQMPACIRCRSMDGISAACIDGLNGLFS
jgi:hypothetical protein